MAANEGLVLGSLNLNDEVKFVTNSLQFTPASAKSIWASNAAADGDALVEEPHYNNASFELEVRVVPTASTEAALKVLGELTDAVQGCARIEGGQELKWTPAEGPTTYTYYAVLGEIIDLPTDLQSGWLVKSPSVKVKLTCRPFGYTPERTIKAATESGAEPIQTLYVKEVKGDVPAEARVIITDKATQDRRFAQWGKDVVSSESNPSLLVTAGAMVTTEFSGEAKTRSGAYGEEKVKRATAITSASTVCSTGKITHTGSYAVYLRAYPGSEAARFRISYRNGDGPLIPLEWQTPSVSAAFTDMLMGEVFLDEVALGTQTSEIRIEHKSTTGTVENDINYLTLLPTSAASGTARGLSSSTGTKLQAFDNFNQTAGNLEGKALGLGGTWAEVVNTGGNGFKVNETTDLAERTKVSDAALNAGCYAWAGTAKYQNVTVSVSSILTSAAGEAEKPRFGVLAAGASSESEKNWIGAFISAENSVTEIGTFQVWRLKVYKRVAGTETFLGQSFTSVLATPLTGTFISLSVDTSGNWTARADVLAQYYTSKIALEAKGQDAVLATGGTLGEGKVGMYDAWTSAVANTRTYDGFQVVGTDAAGRVCFSGKQIEFRSDGALRQDATGTYTGPPSLYRGGNLYLDPAGNSGQINRLAIRMRRTDTQAEQDATVTDKHSVEVKVRERFIAPR